jgi:type IV secretion system protein VirB6
MDAAIATTTSDLLLSVDVLGTVFTRYLYESLARALQPIFFAMLVLYVIWWGFSMIVGRSSPSPIEAMERLIRAVLIYWLATSWGAFAHSIYAIVQAIPVFVGSRIVAAIDVATGSPASSADIMHTLDTLYTMSIKIAEQIYLGSLMDGLGGLLSILVILFTLAFLGISVAAILVTKLVLHILLALGPIWLVLALYNYSSRFTDGFLSISAKLIIQQVLVYAFLGFFSGLVMLAVGAADMASTPDLRGGLAQVMPLLLVEAVGCYLLIQVPGIAGTIVGGGPLGFRRRIAFVAGAVNLPIRSRNGIAADASIERPEQVMRSIQRETTRNSSVWF